MLNTLKTEIERQNHEYNQTDRSFYDKETGKTYGRRRLPEKVHIVAAFDQPSIMPAPGPFAPRLPVLFIVPDEG